MPIAPTAATPPEAIIIPTDALLNERGACEPTATDPSGLDPRFWLLLSSTLPIGGYSFSHGLESAVMRGHIVDFDSARLWIGSLAARVLPALELPLLLRLLRACREGCSDTANYWNDYSNASRETTELLLEETAKGSALVKLFPSLGIRPQVDIEQPGFSAAYATICVDWQLSERDALTGFAWIWFEMLVAAAIKLIPLGHSQGQQLLLAFNAQLHLFAEPAMHCTDADIGASTPGLAMLSSAHETQPSRQFRS